MRNRRGFFLFTFAQDDLRQFGYNAQHRTQAEYTGAEEQNPNALNAQVQLQQTLQPCAQQRRTITGQIRNSCTNTQVDGLTLPGCATILQEPEQADTIDCSRKGITNPTPGGTAPQQR